MPITHQFFSSWQYSFANSVKIHKTICVAAIAGVVSAWEEGGGGALLWWPLPFRPWGRGSRNVLFQLAAAKRIPSSIWAISLRHGHNTQVITRPSVPDAIECTFCVFCTHTQKSRSSLQGPWHHATAKQQLPCCSPASIQEHLAATRSHLVVSWSCTLAQKPSNLAVRLVKVTWYSLSEEHCPAQENATRSGLLRGPVPPGTPFCTRHRYRGGSGKTVQEFRSFPVQASASRSWCTQSCFSIMLLPLYSM